MRKIKNQKGITLVSLVVTIIILIILAGVSINAVMGENGIINLAKRAKENTELSILQEQRELNELYMQIEKGEEISGGLSYDIIKDLRDRIAELEAQIIEKDNELRQKNAEIVRLNGVIESLRSQISELEAENASLEAEITRLNGELEQALSDLEDAQAEVERLTQEIARLNAQINSINSLLNQTNAEASHILKDYKAYSKGALVTGTMENRGAVSKSLNCGESYTIPAGYHNGNGKVSANSLASQTVADATAEDILNGKTAWVNGQLITGVGKDLGDYYFLPLSFGSQTFIVGGYTKITFNISGASASNKPITKSYSVSGSNDNINFTEIWSHTASVTATSPFNQSDVEVNISGYKYIKTYCYTGSGTIYMDNIRIE